MEIHREIMVQLEGEKKRLWEELCYEQTYLFSNSILHVEKAPDHEVGSLSARDCLYCARALDSKITLASLKVAIEQVEFRMATFNRKHEKVRKKKKWHQKIW